MMKPILVSLLAVLLLLTGCDDETISKNNNNTNNNTTVGIPVRNNCTFNISFNAQSESSVKLVGDFNEWQVDKGYDLIRDGYSWTLGITSNPFNEKANLVILQPGEYQYKLVSDGSNWQMDSQNPLSVFDSSQQNENSLMILPDCTIPYLVENKSVVDFQNKSFTVEAQVYKGAPIVENEVTGIESVTATVKKGDTLIDSNVDFNENNGLVTISASNLETGKFRVNVVVTGLSGKTFSRTISLWMEKEQKTWEDMFLYSIFVDRFVNGDSSNDAPIDNLENQVNWQGGDWKGITQKIEDGYFSDLGVTALWISTPMDNPDFALPGDCGMEFSGYHAYWPQSERDVENHFGTEDDLKELVQKAHNRGIRVLVDWAGNHVFEDHEIHLEYEGNPFWFNYPGATNPDEYWKNKCGVLGWNEYALTCWFTEYLPDFNHRNYQLDKRLIDDALWWINTFDLDGFRVDATKHIRSNYLRLLRKSLDDKVESKLAPFYMVGENFIYDYNLINEKVSEHELQGQFDFPLYGTIRSLFVNPVSDFSVLNSFVYNNFIDYLGITDLDWAQEGPSAHGTLMGNFLGNHDVERFSSVAAGDANGDGCQAFNSPLVGQTQDETIYQRMGVAFAFLLTVRGLPVLYYGDEIGLAGVKDPDNRRGMIFDENLMNQGQINLKNMVSRIANVRNSYKSLRTGKYDAFYSDASCLVYMKSLGTEHIIVALSGNSGCNTAVSVKDGYGLLDGVVLNELISETETISVSSGTFNLALAPWSVKLYYFDSAK